MESRTASVGLLSQTYLRASGQTDVVIPACNWRIGSTPDGGEVLSRLNCSLHCSGSGAGTGSNASSTNAVVKTEAAADGVQAEQNQSQGGDADGVMEGDSQWAECLRIICEWGPFKTEDQLMLQLDTVGDGVKPDADTQVSSGGTRILVFSLWEQTPGMTEIDADSDPSDIRLHPAAAGAGGSDGSYIAASAGMDAGEQRHLTYRYSLREYASIL
jgi:hypothetical protein